MPTPTLPKIDVGRGMGRSRSANDREEESIYVQPYGGMMPPAAPKIRTYIVAPTSPTAAATPKARMHGDSSQVGIDG